MKGGALYGLSLFVFLLPALGGGEKVVLSDESYEDFQTGQFDQANLMASRSGQIRWVNNFDLDGDGWNEIVVNNDHNHYETPDAFLYHPDRFGKYRSLYSPLREEMPLYQMLEQTKDAQLTRLQALGAGRSHVADLNGDGWPDIVFANFIHGWSEAPLPTFVYWGAEGGFSVSRRTVLDAFRGTAAASADINQDGRTDLIVANGGREYIINRTAALTPQVEKLADAREKTSYIFLQDETGFSSQRRIELPTLFAIDVKVADFNQDGRMDVAFLEAGKPGRIRIFLNTEKGLSQTPQILTVKAPTWGKLTREFWVGDLDDDGLADIFAPSEGSVSEIFWNSAAGFSEDRKTELPCANAYSAAGRDLDGDQKTDLVVASYSRRDEEKKVSLYGVNSTIFHGDGRRFSDGKKTELPTTGATGVEVADTDGDGRPDLVFSQHRDEQSFDIPSVVFRNTPQGFFPAAREFLGTFGASDVAIVQSIEPGLPAMFFSNRQSGYARYTGTSDAMGGGGGGDSLPHMAIFWGNPASVFGPGQMTLLPSAAPETTLVCIDLNFDGHTDLVYLRGKADELRVRFGEGQGFSDRIVTFPLGFRGKSLVAADFNRDGYVDVVVTALDTPDMAFFAGTAEGFAEARRFLIHGGSQSAACGDFNRDGQLDLAVVGKGFVQVIPGDAKEVFAPAKSEVLSTTMFSSRVCVADLNADGQLDLFVENFSDINATSNAVASWVLFNREGKFSLEGRKEVRTFGATGGSVADVNRDGKPDLVISNYHGDTTRHVSLFIYYGEGPGTFSAQPEELPAYSSSANMVLDLNNDGYPDIVVFNHSESTEYVGPQAMGGKHGTGSFIYWGGAEGFSITRRSWFPSFGPHARINADPGNISTRSSIETFTSGTKNLEGHAGPASMSVVAGRVGSQNIRGEVRFDGSNWQDVPLRYDGHGIWTGRLDLPAAHKVQYRLSLDSGNLGNGPLVESVKISQKER